MFHGHFKYTAYCNLCRELYDPNYFLYHTIIIVFLIEIVHVVAIPLYEIRLRESLSILHNKSTGSHSRNTITRTFGKESGVIMTQSSTKLFCLQDSNLAIYKVMGKMLLCGYLRSGWQNRESEVHWINKRSYAMAGAMMSDHMIYNSPDCFTRSY